MFQNLVVITRGDAKQAYGGVLARKHRAVQAAKSRVEIEARRNRKGYHHLQAPTRWFLEVLHQLLELQRATNSGGINQVGGDRRQQRRENAGDYVQLVSQNCRAVSIKLAALFLSIHKATYSQV